MHTPAAPAEPLTAPSDFAMFTSTANKAVARMLSEFAEQRRKGSEEKRLLRWLRARRGRLALKYPGIYDTAVREAIGQHLRALGLSDEAIADALAYAPPADASFGLPSLQSCRANETLRQGDE